MSRWVRQGKGEAGSARQIRTNPDFMIQEIRICKNLGQIKAGPRGQIWVPWDKSGFRGTDQGPDERGSRGMNEGLAG